VQLQRPLPPVFRRIEPAAWAIVVDERHSQALPDVRQLEMAEVTGVLNVIGGDADQTTVQGGVNILALMRMRTDLWDKRNS
jgi:hypothetical protein